MSPASIALLLAIRQPAQAPSVAANAQRTAASSVVAPTGLATTTPHRRDAPKPASGPAVDRIGTPARTVFLCLLMAGFFLLLGAVPSFVKRRDTEERDVMRALFHAAAGVSLMAGALAMLFGGFFD